MMRVLIVGLGSVGQRHARNLRNLLGHEFDLIAYRVRKLAHVVTPNLQLDESKNVEEEYGIRSFGTLDAALAEKPAVAFICNPSSLHIGIAQACAEAGCDLFIEKPLASSADGVERLIRTVEAKSLIGMVGYQMRYHPCILAIRDALASGELGCILTVSASVGENVANFHRYEDYRTTYAARADLGGGVVLSQIHELDYLYSLLGMPTSVYAIGRHKSSLEIDVEDTATSLLRFEYGGRPLPAVVHQDFLQDPPSRVCEVIGDRGRVFADLRALTVTRYLPGAEPVVTSFEGFDRNTMFVDEVAHFLGCIANRTRPNVDLREGFQSLRIALAVKESMASGELVQIVSNQLDQTQLS